MNELVDIAAVETLGDYRLRLSFADGTIGDVDLARKEWPGVLAPLAEREFFAQVSLDRESGTIKWPNGVDMAPEPLYREARRHRVAPAA